MGLQASSLTLSLGARGGPRRFDSESAVMLTEEQWNNLERGDTIVSDYGELFIVVSRVNNYGRDYCVVRRYGNESKMIEVYSDSHHDFIDVIKG